MTVCVSVSTSVIAALVPSRSVNFLVVASLLVPVIVTEGKNSLFDIFKSFIKNVLNLDNIFPYADNLSSINLNYYQKGQQLGWHFDNASFAITLMIQSSTKGGEFEYITEGRDSNSDYIDKSLLSKVIEGKTKPKLLDVSQGTLILFYGRNYLHRVTPVQSETPRILITLNYNEEDHIKLSENARLTFFGRTD